MTPAELIERNRARATADGRQRASADVTLALEALGHAQAQTKLAIKAGENGLARLQEAAGRVADINLELKNLRLVITSEITDAFDVSQNRWTPSVSTSLKKHLARRTALVDEREAVAETLTQLSDFAVMDAPKLHQAAVNEAAAGLRYLNCAADLITIDVLIASEPLLKLDRNIAIVSASGSEISAHALAIATQVVALDEAKKKLADAEAQARAVVERAA